MSQSKPLTEEDALQLDNQLCFKLYAASRAVIRGAGVRPVTSVKCIWH
jgi:hypothetical protein